MEKVLSISVACYNLGEMILDNLKSFCESDVANDIELIVTDDGSKDNSVEIVEEYAKKFPNIIKLVKKSNEGPGSTVNSGIKNATGKYFRMVDGDDWVDSQNLVEFVELLKKSSADIIVSDFCIYDNKKGEVISVEKSNLEPNKEMEIDDTYLNLPIQMHAMTFKTEIFQKNNILLDNCFYTDVEYLLYPIPFCKTIVYFNKPIYMYRVAQAGQSVNPNSMKKNIKQHELVFQNLLNMHNNKKNNLRIGQKNYICNRLAIMADVQLGTYLLFDASKENKIRIKQFITNLKENYRDIYNQFKKSKKAMALIYSNYLLYPLLAKKYKKLMAN